MSAKGAAISRGRYRSTAARILESVPVPRAPFSVVEFTGGLIPIGRHVTDFHIVDANGCTVWIDSYDGPAKRAYRERRCTIYAATMNELTA